MSSSEQCLAGEGPAIPIKMDMPVRIEIKDGELVLILSNKMEIAYSTEDINTLYEHLQQQQSWFARATFVLVPAPETPFQDITYLCDAYPLD